MSQHLTKEFINLHLLGYLLVTLFYYGCMRESNKTRREDRKKLKVDFEIINTIGYLNITLVTLEKVILIILLLFHFGKIN